MLIKFNKTDATHLTEHFTAAEFACPCPDCAINYIDYDLVNKLELLRVALGPLKITSGYRCPSHNKTVGGVPDSAHQAGMAADVQPVHISKEAIDALFEKSTELFDNIGDGRRLYFVHVDVRAPKPNGVKRTWTY
jgi:uncharacterized protein YcbK (DUF882 family)